MSNRIRQLRKERNLTLLELSKQLQNKENLKLSPDAIAKYERGDREPKLETWKKLAEFYKVPIEYLQGSKDLITLVKDRSLIILSSKSARIFASDTLGGISVDRLNEYLKEDIKRQLENPELITIPGRDVDFNTRLEFMATVVADNIYIKWRTDNFSKKGLYAYLYVELSNIGLDIAPMYLDDIEMLTDEQMKTTQKMYNDFKKIKRNAIQELLNLADQDGLKLSNENRLIEEFVDKDK